MWQWTALPEKSSIDNWSLFLNKFFFISLFAAFFLIPNFSGAEPVNYSVKFPTGDAAWTMTMEKYVPEGKPPVPPQPGEVGIKKIEVVRLGNLRRDIVTLLSGGTLQYWWVGEPAVVFFQNAKNGEIQGMKSSQLQDRRFDETAFTWVGADTFKESKTLKGKKCQFYETEMQLGANKQKYQVWIDAETFLPVAWNNGEFTVTFAFEKTLPTGTLTMPEKFRKELEAVEQYYAPAKRLGAK